MLDVVAVAPTSLDVEAERFDGTRRMDHKLQLPHSVALLSATLWLSQLSLVSDLFKKRKKVFDEAGELIQCLSALLEKLHSYNNNNNISSSYITLLLCSESLCSSGCLTL